MRRRDFIILLAGAMSGWPSAVRAQQKAIPVIGYLAGGSGGMFAAGFRQGLSETGYVEGQNLGVEYRYAGSRYDRLAALAADLVDQKVDVILTVSLPTALVAKNATSTIPIIFLTGSDPVGDGLVASLARHILFGSRKKGPVQCLGKPGRSGGEDPSLLGSAFGAPRRTDPALA
jgi:putative ABC transport system substrate-binding protein